MSDQLRGKFEEIGSLMDDAEHEVLADMEVPEAHGLQIRSTKPLVRLKAEIKWRTNVVGSVLNDPAITRSVGSMLLKQSDGWALQRRYMQPYGLQTFSTTAPAHTPAGCAAINTRISACPVW